MTDPVDEVWVGTVPNDGKHLQSVAKRGVYLDSEKTAPRPTSSVRSETKTGILELSPDHPLIAGLRDGLAQRLARTV